MLINPNSWYLFLQNTHKFIFILGPPMFHFNLNSKKLDVLTTYIYALRIGPFEKKHQ